MKKKDYSLSIKCFLWKTKTNYKGISILFLILLFSFIVYGMKVKLEEIKFVKNIVLFIVEIMQFICSFVIVLMIYKIFKSVKIRWLEPLLLVLHCQSKINILHIKWDLFCFEILFYTVQSFLRNWNFSLWLRLKKANKWKLDIVVEDRNFQNYFVLLNWK